MTFEKETIFTATKAKLELNQRPRRNRKSRAIRDLVRENKLSPADFVLPLFVTEGKERKEPILSMPDYFRLSTDLIIREAKEAHALGIPAIALFPALTDQFKDKYATEAVNPNGLLQTTIRELKSKAPDMLIITDVAMDPYSSDGHDGFVENGEILNDETLEILADMSVAQAKAGADFVAPSDMMDGRVGMIRKTLDQNGFQSVGIISYSAKYASSFYGPFRDALDSKPRGGDKKTYQMDPANSREALREVALDIKEGADIVMIKPALAYLDIIRAIKENVHVPVAAYNVSGEYAMIKAAAEKGWLCEEAAVSEMLLSMKRAGADIIFSYFAKQAAKSLS